MVLRFYSRFKTKWVLQKRTLRKFHVDHHYGAKYIKLWKELYTKFQNDSLAIMLDDKAAIPVGHPGAPVGVARRQRRVLASEDDLNSCYHDNVA